MAKVVCHSVTDGLLILCIAVIKQGKNKPLKSLPLGASTIFTKLSEILEAVLNNPNRQFCYIVAVLVALGYGVKKGLRVVS